METVNCQHPLERQMYRQLNQPGVGAEITVMDLIGGINPYVWREEYCGVCGKVLMSFGNKPTPDSASAEPK